MNARTRDRRVYLAGHPMLFALLTATRRRPVTRLGGTLLIHDRAAFVAALTRVPLDRTAAGTTGGAAGRLTDGDLLFDQHGEAHRRSRRTAAETFGAAGVARLRPIWQRVFAERLSPLAHGHPVDLVPIAAEAAGATAAALLNLATDPLTLATAARRAADTAARAHLPGLHLPGTTRRAERAAAHLSALVTPSAEGDHEENADAESPRAENVRADEARPENTSTEKTGAEKPGTEKTGTAQAEAAQAEAAQAEAAQAEADEDNAEKARIEQAGATHAYAEQAGSNRASANRAGAEQTGAEQAGAEQAGAEQAGAGEAGAGLAAMLAVAAISTTVAALPRAAAWAADAELWGYADSPALVDELFRVTAPTPLLPRVAAAGAVLPGGCPVRAGDRMLLVARHALDAHHLDPDPEHPMPARIAQLVFGAGPHACPGARLARTQLGDFLRALAVHQPVVVRARADRHAALPSWRSLVVQAGDQSGQNSR
ncbi:cytochrome P450 [Actinoplanes sp. NPDC051494]|uniref:cytochrome P450 n=1 Tax=Actinoplanes sp. NPDC051494 TaxID=3363907 RepID=UPI0037B9EAFE